METDISRKAAKSQRIEYGFSEEEFRRVRELLKREPNAVELAMFSVMWSEHCSYKSSKADLKKFPVEGKNILVKAGKENAGVIDIGEGYAITFKIESHNHPSAVAPFQGAATGVGGIIRDILAMGARPIALSNSLRFGKIQGKRLESQRHRHLFSEVVRGISRYGNGIGVPNVGGEVYFDESYAENPLVNVWCLGLLKKKRILKGDAAGVGNPIFYIGAKTGRDGLGGASFASRDLAKETQEDLPSVQVGDPFLGKLLIEACLELYQSSEIIVSVQDLGAGGLTCGLAEMAARGKVGITVDLARVPQREKGMSSEEILLSESQERMVMVIKKGEESKVVEIAKKWNLEAASIGVVTDDGMFRLKKGDERVAEISAADLVDGVSLVHHKARVPVVAESIQIEKLPKCDLQESLLRMISSPTIASKRWIFEQYDHQVGVGTVVLPGSDAAVVRVPIDQDGKIHFKYLALTTEGNGFYCKLDPCQGGKIAVAEAARNLACSGAVPLGVTDNLNFGNPQEPENFWEFQQTIDGIAEACRFFEVPVVGGNVSFYNQSQQGRIDPTPVIGMVGLIEHPDHITTQWFKEDRDAIVLIGEIGEGLGGSHFLKEFCEIKKGSCPILDLEQEQKIQDAVRSVIRMGFIKSAHDCSEGGLGVALVECCASGPEKILGAEIDLSHWDHLSDEELLFNESPSRVVVSVRRENATALIELLKFRGVPAYPLGHVGGRKLEIKFCKRKVEWPISDLAKAWKGAIGKIMA